MLAALLLLHVTLASDSASWRAEMLKDFNVMVYNSTYRVVGDATRGGTEGVATAFFLTENVLDTVGPSRRAVMVTARHVLDSTAGLSLRIKFRRWRADGRPECVSFPVAIRDSVKDLWTPHPDGNVDVAAMRVVLPSYADSFMPVLPVEALFTDSSMLAYWIGPGMSVACIGFPYGEAADSAASPMLRQGMIASYPLAPSSVIRSFLVDVPTYGGCSGSPVYIAYKGERPTSPGSDTVQLWDMKGVVGMITGRPVKEYSSKWPDQTETRRYTYGVASVVPAQLIREVIDLLP